MAVYANVSSAGVWNFVSRRSEGWLFARSLFPWRSG
jgi:hypothetical protein